MECGKGKMLIGSRSLKAPSYIPVFLPCDWLLQSFSNNWITDLHGMSRPHEKNHTISVFPGKPAHHDPFIQMKFNLNSIWFQIERDS